MPLRRYRRSNSREINLVFKCNSNCRSVLGYWITSWRTRKGRRLVMSSIETRLKKIESAKLIGKGFYYTTLRKFLAWVNAIVRRHGKKNRGRYLSFLSPINIVPDAMNRFVRWTTPIDKRDTPSPPTRHENITYLPPKFFFINAGNCFFW